MKTFVIFYQTKKKEGLFWFTVAKDEKEAKRSFLRDYKEMPKDKEMNKIGYWTYQVPPVKHLLDTRDELHFLNKEDYDKK